MPGICQANWMKGNKNTDHFQITGINCIFKSMRVAPFIFSFSCVLLFAFLTFEPLLHQPVPREKPACSQSKCSKEDKDEEKGDCANRGCNPLFPCAMGGCCYVIEELFSNPRSTPSKIKKPLPVNDNTLENHVAECWHPPEALS